MCKSFRIIPALVMILIFFVNGCGNNNSHESNKFNNMTKAEQIDYIDKAYHERLINLISLFNNSYSTVVNISSTEGEFYMNTKLLCQEIFLPKFYNMEFNYSNKLIDEVYPLYSSYDNLYDKCTSYVSQPILYADVQYDNLPWYKKIWGYIADSKSLFPNTLSIDFIKYHNIDEEYIEIQIAELIYQDTLSKLKYGHGVYKLNKKNFDTISNGMTEYDVIKIFNMPPCKDEYFNDKNFDENSHWCYWYKIDTEKLYNIEYISTDYTAKPTDKDKYIRVRFIWDDKKQNYVVCDKEYNL